MLPDFATRSGLFLAIVLQLMLAAIPLPAQTTAFTYQGRLLDGTQPANGSYDLQFRLADACSNGNYVGNPLTSVAVPVSNGLFAVTLDFGGGVFDGSPRWLEIRVRTNGSGAPYTLLSPRQAITATPYAMFAAGLAPGVLITADGAGITNLNGAFIQAGTINSNQLDQATAAQLSLGGGAIAATNPVLYFPKMLTSPTNSVRLLVTNIYGFHNYQDHEVTTWAESNSLVLLMDNIGAMTNGAYLNNSNRTRGHLLYRGVNGAYWDDFFNPFHDGTNATGSEMQTTSSGGWAIGLNYSGTLQDYAATRRAWQWGIGGWGQAYIYHQYNKIFHRWETNFTDACFPEQWKCAVFTNAPGEEPKAVWAGCMQPTTGNVLELPTMLFRGYSLDGSGAWTWYDNFNSSVDKEAQWVNMETATKRFEIIAGPSGGVNINGAVNLTNATITINGALGLTTNYTLSTGDVMSISNGLIVRIAPPLPYVWHEVATNYLARINTELASPLATNVNQFVADAAPSGVLTNLDGCYLFPGDEGMNAQNLLSTNYALTYSGTFVSNDATGIEGDGSGYADTHWVNSQVNSGTFWFYRSKNGTIPSATTYVGVFGARDNEDITGMYIVSTDSQWHGGLNGAKWGGTVGIVANAAPGSIGIVRAGSNQCYVYTNGGTTPYVSSATASSAVPANSVWLFGMNNTGGNTFNAWDGKLQGFAMGTNAISGSQSAALYSAMTNFNARMGR